MAICKRGVIQALVSFLGVEILTTFWFLWYNFWSRYARKPIKGSKNSWDNLISKKYLGQNVGPFDGRPGPVKIGHKNAKTSPLVTFPQENSKPKTENFFWLGTRRLAESGGFEHLSSCSSWRVMAKRVPATTVTGAGVKGLFLMF